MGAALLSALWVVSAGPAAQAQEATGTLTIDMTKPGAAISPTLFGVFFEEINHAGDGGLYGELLQNRAFEDKASLLGWAPAPSLGGAAAVVSLDTTAPLSAQSPHSLRLDITNAGTMGAGVVNGGFWGVPVKMGEKYRFSFYARSAALRYSGTVRVRLEGAKRQVYAEAIVSGVDSTWKRFSGEMQARGTPVGAVDPSCKFVVLATAPGIVWMDGASLFGPTYKNRPNGLRSDLAQLTADLNPAFIRFPGGCFVEGDYLANAFRWKTTLGEPVLRPGHQSFWGYRSSDGLGYHDYLQMCEDLNALPLYVVNCGMSHHDTVPLIDLDPWIQDALDALDYANAPASNPWGKLRAEAGHKAPFNVRYVEVGNENGGPVYEERFARFQAAIKARYPSVNIIVNNWNGVPQTVPYDLVDDHIYTTANALAARADQYDSRSRQTKAKVYVGEIRGHAGSRAGQFAGRAGRSGVHDWLGA